MDERDVTNERLRESIENAKRLKRELEQKIFELSKLIETAEGIKDGAVRTVEAKEGPSGH